MLRAYYGWPMKLEAKNCQTNIKYLYIYRKVVCKNVVCDEGPKQWISDFFQHATQRESVRQIHIKNI
jgi:hypothetical protein